MIFFSRFLAGLYLVFSLIVSVMVLANYSEPIWIGVGVGIAFQGLMVFVLFMLVAKIAENMTNTIKVGADTVGEKTNEEISAPKVANMALPNGIIHRCILETQHELLLQLINSGADVNEKRKEDGKTPLEVAKEIDDSVAIDLLLSRGAV